MKKATKRPIIRRTEKEKLALIEQWEQSGLSIKRFCDGQRFSDSLFHGWLNKYRRRKEGKAPGKFVAVQVRPPSAPAEDDSTLYAEVMLKDGNRIKLYHPIAAEYLRTLIA